MQRAFKLADKVLQRELREKLREVAEPVRATAERLAVERIPTVGLPWSRMKVGVTPRSVYIVPRQRGRRHRRPAFGNLLLGRSMVPAVEQNEPRVLDGMEDVLVTVGRAWERV